MFESRKVDFLGWIYRRDVLLECSCHQFLYIHTYISTSLFFFKKNNNFGADFMLFLKKRIYCIIIGVVQKFVLGFEVVGV